MPRLHNLSHKSLANLAFLRRGGGGGADGGAIVKVSVDADIATEIFGAL